MFTYQRSFRVLCFIVILTMLFSGLPGASVSAQGSDGIQRQINPQTGRLSFIGPEMGQVLPARNALNSLFLPQDPAMALAKRFGSEFGLKNPERELSQIKSTRAENGRITTHYQQTYQGIPVMAGELIVNTNQNGDLYSMNGEASRNLSLSIQPKITDEEAKQTALQAMAKWYGKTPEEFSASDPELWIYDESLLRRGTRPAELVWRMEIAPKDSGMPIRELILVNAQQSGISLHFNQIDIAWSRQAPSETAREETSTSTPLPTESPLVSPIEEPISTENRLIPDPAENATTSVGVTWYVATTGSNSNTCASTSSPCKTINAAIGKATTGDTILVATGTYTNTGTQVVVISKNVTISGGWNPSFTAQSGMSVIDGQGLRRGVLVNPDVHTTIDHFIIQNGSVKGDTGGGIRNYLGTVTLNNSIVSNNLSNIMGGGIYNYGSFTINNSAIRNNVAGDFCCSGGGGGAGIANNSGTLTLNNTTITGNTLRGGFSGAGIVAWGTVTLNNSTVSNNTGGRGVGIDVLFGTTTLNNSTVSGNESYGIRNTSGTIFLQNTIVAGNGDQGDCYKDPSYAGSITSLGHNLIGSTSECTFIPAVGDQLNLDASLGALIGFPGYIPLLPNSPAIDAGNPAVPGSGGSACLTTDQRGVARPVGAGCDIGAYEYTVPGSVASLSIVQGDEQRTAPRLTFSQPLVVAALDSQGSPVAGVSVTFTAPASSASGTFADTQSRTTTAVTDSNGVATASPFTANSVLGAYTVSAAAGVSTIHFNIQNFAWFVAPNGNNTNSCSTPGSPCATLDTAISKIANGDTILIAIGQYTSSAPEGIVINDKSVILSGGWNQTFTTQAGVSTLDGQGVRHGITMDNNAYVVIDHFSIQNATGAGITNYYSVIEINNSIVANNKSVGILNHGTMTVNKTTISNNTGGDPCCVGGGGGAGIDHSAGILTLNNSLVSNNILLGGFSGSGIYVGVGTLILNNSTVSGNTGGDGAGIATFGGNIILKNSTISFNQSYGLNNTAGDVIMQNTIIAHNGGRDCYKDHNYSGGITSQGYNLIGNGTQCSFTPVIGDLVGSDANPIDPHIAPLQNYGGPTFTHALMSGSPAIDMGNPEAPGSGEAACLPTDQRGIARAVGAACDIGAFEYNGRGTKPTYIFTYAGTPQTVFRGSPSVVRLKALVVDEKGDSASGVAVTFTAPATGASGIFIDTNTNAATVITDANGVATAPVFKANNALGDYVIVATASGINGSINFQITNAIVPIQTYTASQGSYLPGYPLCDETALSCTNGQNPHADKAHLYALGTSNLYAAKHNRAGIDENNMPIISTVNYCDPYFPCPYANAFWNGEQMVYGDAYGFPLADDVVAHELTHGVTEHESNLFYYYQSGAINESFSDLWGEYYDQTNSLGNDTAAVKWLHGEDVSGLGAQRSMSNPPAFKDPDKMSSTHYYEDEDDNGGVHTNSGVNNKAVYLMVDGGTFNGKTITALGWDKTASIYYEVNTHLLVSGADYSDLYYALQTACSNLIGQKGITAVDCAEVKDAIDAVEMNGQPALNFSTDAPICVAGGVPEFLFTDDLEAGTANWTFSNGTDPRWQWDSPYGPYAQSGLHSLYADDYPDKVTDATSRLKSLAIPANAYLHFAHAYGFESGYNTGDLTLHHFDGGVLEYSINNGVSWADAGSLIDYNGYKGVVFTGASNPLSGRSAFVGDSHGYISSRLDLASLAGKSVMFRWRMGLDELGGDWGWWIDNVKLYTCRPVLPDVFHKTSPANAAVDQPTELTLNWSVSAGAVSYQVCYDILDDNQCNRSWVSASATSAKISNLGINTTYYWQVRAVNAAGTTDADGSSWASFTTTATLPPGFASIEAFVGTTQQGKYSLAGKQSLRESFLGVNNGPVNIRRTGNLPLIGAERVIYNVNGVNTSFTELMGLPNSQLDKTYWLPWYNNKDLDTQLRIANVSRATATVNVYVGGAPMAGNPITLLPGASIRKSYFGVNDGPVKIESDVPIVVAERVVYKVNGVGASFTEMMALPNSHLDTTYWLPWYNNKDLDTQLRIANVTELPTTITITIGSVKMPAFDLPAGESTRVSYAGINNGPVKIESTQNIVAAERVVFKVNNINTSFTEMMAHPKGQLDTAYWLPWYNNKDLDTQLRFANTTDQPASVHIYIGGIEMGTGFSLGPGESTRQSFINVNNGPVQIVSDQPIVVAERVVYKVNNIHTSFSEMMALPDSQLDTSYWLPWYNNKDLDTQLRFGVP